jgi:hypothetical protein
VWYPAAAAVEAASAVAVKGAGETPGIDFKLARSRAYRIHVQVTDPDAATDGRIPSISLYPKGLPVLTPVGRVARTPNGDFEISGVPSGSYVLVARAAPQMQTGPVQQTRMGMREIEVKDASVDGVKIEIGAGRDVRASLRIEGSASFSPGMISFVARDGVSPQARILNQMMPMRTPEVTLQNVFRTTYALELPSAGSFGGANYYVKSLRYGGREYPADAVDLSGDGELEIVVSPLGATVEGTAVDAAGKPSPNAVVVIAPASGVGPLKNGAADARGNFYFGGLAPGEYRVFAWDAGSAEATDPPPSLAPYQSAAKTVRLEQSAREKTQVTVTAAK